MFSTPRAEVDQEHSNISWQNEEKLNKKKHSGCARWPFEVVHLFAVNSLQKSPLPLDPAICTYKF